MELTSEEARRRFVEEEVLRLSTADAAGRPHVVPATFAVKGDVIVIAVDHKPKRGVDLKRLRNIAENAAVSVLADHYESDWNRLWWCRADGEAEVMANEDAAELVDLLVYKYSQYRERRPAGPVIQIRVSRWSGWSATTS